MSSNQNDEGIADKKLCEQREQEHLIHRFEYGYRLLLGGKEWVLDRPQSHLAFDVLECMVSLLNQGGATLEMQKLLAEYLQKTVSGWDEKTALNVLGVAKDGRSNKNLERVRAIDAYQVCLEQTGSDEEALRAAWTAYFPGVDIAEEINRPAGEGGCSYGQQLAKTIKPLLHKAEVRNPDMPGRPRKFSKKL